MEKIVFVVGAGRSGTTWLQLMLGSHAAIATGQESQLFNNYFSHLVQRWQGELAYPQTSDLRFHGISAYIDENCFYRLLTRFAVGVFDSVLSAKPGATYFLEKSPNNSLHIPTILRCFPQAKIIHLLRDGRDVTTSILAAKKSWGRNWSHNTVEDAALEWSTAVSECAKARHLTSNYLEVRYEDLLATGPETLKTLFQFLDIPISLAEIQAIYGNHTFEKLKANQYDKSTFINPGQSVASGTTNRSEPKNFFRKGKVGDWKNSLNHAQQQEFYWVAGRTMAQKGYISEDLIPKVLPLRLRIRYLSRFIRKAAKRLLGAALQR
ncbi:sulfotransferase family protein [Teredinibacter haidensis]|uniref:sulfotransferase family protein n=1 Tax=Teredinibacter haidensis TaxID=2731755 RepID=UPI000948F8B2|nr:sulfotransferase [Teredinibacter haidensis]